MEKIKVLLAESYSPLLKLMKISLSEEFIVMTATNGVAALSIIRNFDIDCLVSNVNLPFLNGIALLRYIREEAHQIKTIIITSSDDNAMERECRRLGAQCYLTQPLSMEYLKCQIYDSIGKGFYSA